MQGLQVNFFPGGVPDPQLLPPLEPPWGHVRPVRTYGREGVIDAMLQDWPRREGSGKAVVLCGVGGVGKTTVALEVCRAARAMGRDVWWVSAVDRASFEGGMRAVGYAAGAAPEAFTQANHADVVWRALSARDRPWILVVDDADDVSALTGAGAVADESGWIRRPPGHGMLLVTSRDGSRSTWRWLVPRKVEALAPADGGAVLLELAPAAGDTAAAAALSTRLGGLPQLLQLAGSTLAENGRIPEAWIDRATSLRTFDDYSRALQAHSGGQRAARSLDALLQRVWDISFGQIDKLQLPHARRVLMLLCCFEDGPLPYERVLDPGLLASSGLIPGITPAALLGAIEGLDGLGLVTLIEGSSGASPPHRGAVLVVPDVMLAATRAHPDLQPPGGDDYRRMAMRLLLHSLGEHATGNDGDVRGRQSGATWPGPTPRVADATTAVRLQAAVVALERMTERQIDVYEEALELTVIVSEDDDRDVVVENRVTTTHPGFVCRSVQPISPDDDPRVWDLVLEVPDHQRDDARIFGFLGTTGRPRVVAFLRPSEEPQEWRLTYSARGLFDNFREGNPDYLYYDTRGPRRGTRPTITHFGVTFVFPSGRGHVQETLGRGSMDRGSQGRATVYRWTPDVLEGERYFWQLWR